MTRTILIALSVFTLFGIAPTQAWAGWTAGDIEFIEGDNPEEDDFYWGTGGAFADELGENVMRSTASAYLTVQNNVLQTGQGKNLSRWRRSYFWDNQGGGLTVSVTLRTVGSAGSSQ